MTNPIGWCDRTWNCVTGCSPVSPACEHCYARRMANRLRGRAGYPRANPFAVTLHPDRLAAPLHWRKPRRIFVCSMGDLFHERVPDEFIWRAFNMATSGNRRHTYLFLTKRPERMRLWFGTYQERFWHYHDAGEPPRPYVSAPWPDPQLWLGVSVEDQATADERIPPLLQTPAAVRFVSVEPMLEPVDLWGVRYPWQDGHAGLGSAFAWGDGIKWVIAGSETGPGARPAQLGWFRSLRDQCQAASVPFWLKQTGTRPEQDTLLDGREWRESPACGRWQE